MKKSFNQKKYNLIALCAFGLESLVENELRRLGFNNIIKENGMIYFKGDERDIARTNISLRVAERVVIKVREFNARDFEDIYQNTLAVKWEDIIPLNGEIYVTGKSVKSKLTHVPSCQSTVKKAIIEGMKRKYPKAVFKEDGPLYKIQISLNKDRALLAIDTTGAGLHKRGYRTKAGDAPLKESLASALVILSRVSFSSVLVDPLCGAGTIPIEAALFAINKAPGIDRSFASEEWPQIPKTVWDRARTEARNRIRESKLKIIGSDQDKQIIEIAKQNAKNAGVDHIIDFHTSSFSNFNHSYDKGWIVCNPPYGDRIGEEEEVQQLYKSMGTLYKKLQFWSFNILTGYSNFEKLFNKKADKNRKLYNGKIQCYYYQYKGVGDGSSQK